MASRVLIAALAVVLPTTWLPPAHAQTRRFERVLYMHGLEPNAAAWRAIRDFGFTAVSSRGGDHAAVRAAGLTFYRDQVIGKGELELREDTWSALLERHAADRSARTLVRPACLADPELRSALRARLTSRLGSAREAGSELGVCLADEPSLTRHTHPLDLCHGPHCLARFRAELEARYGRLANLEVAWGARYEGWDDVVPWTADRIRVRELREHRLPRNLTPWSDHLEFRDALFAEVIHDLLAQAREHVDSPVGITGLQPPAPYGGYDYSKLVGTMDFYEVYDIGAARELARSLVVPHAREYATLFPPNPGEPSELVQARVFDMVAHGLSGVIVWSAGGLFGPDLRPGAFGQLVVSAFDLVGAAGDVFAGARMRYAPIWIVESQASVRAHWMLDSAADGATWLRRTGSYEREHSTSQASRESWLRLIQDVGYQPRFVAAPDLATRLRAARPRLLVLPAQLAMSDPTAAAIRSYVQAGGCVVADYGVARYDERLRLRAVPALDDVFGIARVSPEPARAPRVRGARGEDELRAVAGVAIAEPDVRAEIGEPVRGGASVHCEHRYGKGNAVFLNLAVCEYRAVRLSEAGVHAASDLRARMRRVIADDARIAPPVVVRARGLPHCLETITLESMDARTLLAVRVNALRSPELLARMAARGPRDVTLVFPTATRVRDLRSGRDLGVGREFTMSLDVAAALLLQIDEEGR